MNVYRNISSTSLARGSDRRRAMTLFEMLFFLVNVAVGFAAAFIATRWVGLGGACAIGLAAFFAMIGLEALVARYFAKRVETSCKHSCTVTRAMSGVFHPAAAQLRLN